MSLRVSRLSVVVPLLAAIGCSSAQDQPPAFPTGSPIALLDRPVHLGDDRAGGQDFPTGEAVAAKVCAMVTLPKSALVHIQVKNVRHTESLGDVLQVNGESFPLGITLERDLQNRTSNSTSASPMFSVALSAGPSRICIAAARRRCGDIDDFEVDQVNLYVGGIDLDEVPVRRNDFEGRPAPVCPPSTPWGREQHYCIALPDWCREQP